MPPPAPRSSLRTSPATANELALLHRSALPRPGTAPGEFDLACWSRPLHAIGGDLLDAWPDGRGRLFVFLGDVMGHDLTAAVVASAVRLDLYRARQGEPDSPAEILRRLDGAVGELFRQHFVTAACCLLDAKSGTLTWSLAGHCPVLLRGPSGEVRQLHHRAYALGMSPGESYHDEVAPLPPGATVLLYSDGVSEPIGSPDLLAELIARQDASADETVKVVRRAVRPHRRRDDRAVLAVRVRAA